MAIPNVLSGNLFHLIQDFQYGVFEDLQTRFEEVYDMVKYELSFGSENPGMYQFPPYFRDLRGVKRNPDDNTMILSSDDLCLHERHRDPRLPLHLAILEGNLEVVQRILKCRPDLGSMDALFCAVNYNHEDIVAYLIEAMDKIPQLRRPPTEDAKRVSFRNFHLLDVAANKQNLAILKMLHTSKIATATTSALDNAARAGSLDMVKFLVANRNEGATVAAIDNAATNGHLVVLQFLLETFPHLKVSSKTMDTVASFGELKVLKYLHSIQTVCTQSAMDHAARGGHLEVVQFLHFNRTEGCTIRAMDEAASNGHLNVVKFLNDHRHEGCSRGAVNGAAFWGRTEVLKFLYEHQSEPGTLDPWIRNVIQGNIEILELLFKKHGTFGAIDFAIEMTNAQVVEFLIKVGQPLTNIFPMSFPVAELMHKQGYTFTKDHVTMGAASGNLDLVQFYHSINAPFSPDAMNYAASRGHLEIVKFLHNHRDEGCTTNAMDDVTYLESPSKALEVVKFLHSNRKEGCTTRALDGAAGCGMLELVKFLSENRNEGCTVAALYNALCRVKFDVATYLINHRKEGCAPDAMDVAAHRGYLPILKSLWETFGIACTHNGLCNAIKLGQVHIVNYICANMRLNLSSSDLCEIETLAYSLSRHADYDNFWELTQEYVKSLKPHQQ